MSKIIITGGAGFIGSHLAQYCLNKGHDVYILDDLSGGFMRNVPTGSVFINCNLVDKEAVENIFNTICPDYVYHLAAYAAEGLSHFIRNFNYHNNLIASINIINECIKHKVKRLVFTSSMGVYGTNQVPYNEEMIPSPEDPYGIAKFSVEQDLKVARRMFGLNYTIFRPHNVVGPNQNISDSYRNVIGIFINQVMSGNPMTIFGDGTQVRAFSYVKDMLPYFYDALTNDKALGNIYNIGGEVPYTINEIVDRVRGYMGGSYVNEPPRVEVHIAYSDHTKLYRDFGKLSKLTLIDEWLPIFIDWAKEIGPQETTKFNGVEILDNLPPKWKKLII